MPVKRVLLSWSSGKDSAWALHVLRGRPDVEVVGLITTVNRARGRVSVHAVRVELLRRQAEAAGLPLRLVDLPDPCSNIQYEAAFKAVVDEAARQGVGCMAFGDLFLRDVREYREAQLAGTGLAPLFPLWGLPTDELAREMVGAGLRAVVSCVDPRQLPAGFAGREFDAAFLSELPGGVDPCGERGEFHTFAFAGPMFDGAVGVRAGEVVERAGFIYADILPASGHGLMRK
jgi:uncharacterized protein (TIGR00290 family)